MLHGQNAPQHNQPTRQDEDEILKLNRSGGSLCVNDTDWREALAGAEPDSDIGIRHAVISGDSNYRLHVAAIPDQVACHVHQIGDEDYSIVEGQGDLHFGRVSQGPEGLIVQDEDWRVLSVSTGDSFVIPQGFAHQLRKSGGGDLTIIFGCPDSHLSDDEDRTMLADAPEREGR